MERSEDCIRCGRDVGSSHDYQLALNFNTGRTVETISCGDLPAVVAKNPPEWMILSHDNFTKCLSDGDRAKFSASFLMGAQVLLSRRIPSSKLVDLTPLELELKAVIDCKAPPYPRDRWHRYVGD